MSTPLQPKSPLVIPFHSGGELLLRPLTPTKDDRQRCHNAFDRLSPEARMSRFWTRSQHLSDKVVTRLITADQIHDVVWAAIDPNRPWIPGLGGASFWSSNQPAHCAEFSITIGDHYQNQGLGTLLLALLWTIARHRDIREFVAHIRPENKPALHWLGAMGGTSKAEAGEIIVEWPLIPAQRLLASRSATQRAVGQRMKQLEPLLFPNT
ncbi:GNAT family N-acetyltransferase [Sulfuriroseicoccus oceanibius]|uniref:GNAT family N-acetyltransferase n=1 Tax=Sulfuriroseicoccus oceanibius TaxID=2707525 RepID=A0A6B3L1S4_9BACT|nr:GNAT family N-acetyltransferase [Sulfuriroseicoccus oceanibius]QQL45494.1 GNAT family N-acetyltransferase [Sulfuriroseicoccus oceanibius]